MIIVIEASQVDACLEKLKALGEKAQVIGEIAECKEQQARKVEYLNL